MVHIMIFMNQYSVGYHGETVPNHSSYSTRSIDDAHECLVLNLLYEYFSIEFYV